MVKLTNSQVWNHLGLLLPVGSSIYYRLPVVSYNSTVVSHVWVFRLWLHLKEASSTMYRYQMYTRSMRSVSSTERKSHGVDCRRVMLQDNATRYKVHEP